MRIGVVEVATRNGSDRIRYSHPVLSAFLEAYAVTGIVTIAARQAAEALGKDYRRIRNMHYEYLKKDEDYRQAFEIAHLEAIDHLEAEARRRAVEGTERPIYYKGRKVGAFREYSDQLLMFLLKGAAPEKYADRVKQEHSGGLNLSGTPFAGMTLDEIAEVLAKERDTPSAGDGGAGE